MDRRKRNRAARRRVRHAVRVAYEVERDVRASGGSPTVADGMARLYFNDFGVMHGRARYQPGVGHPLSREVRLYRDRMRAMRRIGGGDA